MSDKSQFYLIQLSKQTSYSDTQMQLIKKLKQLSRNPMLGSLSRSMSKVSTFMLVLQEVKFLEVKNKELLSLELLSSNQRFLFSMKQHQLLIRRMNKKCKLLLMLSDKNQVKLQLSSLPTDYLLSEVLILSQS